MVRKNKTPFRPNLGLVKTLPSLLTIKLATEEPCHKYSPPPQVVKRAGKVTWEYNKQHRKASYVLDINFTPMFLCVVFTILFLNDKN